MKSMNGWKTVTEKMTVVLLQDREDMKRVEKTLQGSNDRAMFIKVSWIDVTPGVTR